MKAATKLDILRAVFVCAWIDGEIQESEKKVLSEILMRIEIADEVHSIVTGWMQTPPEENDELWERLAKDPSTANTVFYQVVNMAAADQVFQFSEMQMIVLLREKLGIDIEESQKIIKDIERIMRLRSKN